MHFVLEYSIHMFDQANRKVFSLASLIDAIFLLFMRCPCLIFFVRASEG